MNGKNTKAKWFPRLLLPARYTLVNRLFTGGRMSGRGVSILLLGLGLCLIIYWATVKAVSYFHSQNELGIILSLKIFQMGWMTIFAMLIFSSMVTTVSTFYLSEDNEILLSSPLRLSEIYLMRFSTTSIYTSWMMIVFSLPVFCAFGKVFQADLPYYLLLIPALVCTAAIGCGSATLVTILLVHLFPAKRTKDIVFYLSLCFGILLYFVFRLIRPEELVNPEKYSQFVEYLSAISTPAGPWLPAGWAADMLSSYLLDRQIDSLLFGLLLTTPLICYFGGEMAMNRFFATGFSKSQESFGGHRTFRPVSRSTSPFSWIVRKEMKQFLRDSSEWSQLFMIGALIIVYLYNFNVLPLDRAPFRLDFISNLIAFGNISLSGFLISSLAARFVYPSIGAEGGAFYLLRSSPLSLERFFLYKYLFYLFPFTVLSLTLIVVSNHMLQIEGAMWWISLFTGLVICWTTIGMALGFGAFFVDFKAENRVASMGSGAILYLFWSITYQLVVVGCIAFPAYRIVKSQLLDHFLPLADIFLCVTTAAGVLVVSCILGVFLCKKGIRALS